MQQGTRVVVPEPYRVVTESFDIPDPGPGQVLIATEASAVSAGTELAIYTGIHQWLGDPNRVWPKFPFIPGYSAVGRIVAVGEGITSFAAGDRVIWSGRHQSHALVDVADDAQTTQAMVRHIGEHVPAPVAACTMLARFPLTALVRSGQVLGQCVAVLGLGLIGQLTLRLFAAAGAYPLIGVDPVEHRRTLATHEPGVVAVDPTAGDLSAALRAINDGVLPDIVVDATGAPNAVKTAMSVVVNGGQVVMVGSPRGIAGEVDFYWDLHGRSISLIGAHGSALGIEPREKFPFPLARAMRTIVHLIEHDKLQIDDLLTHHVLAGELQAMYEGLLHRQDEYLGVTLHW